MKSKCWTLLLAFCAVTAVTANESSQVYGPIKSGETLYQIATNYEREDLELTQIISMIYTNNPQAFLDGNINRLKVGAMLKLSGLEISNDLSDPIKPLASAPLREQYGPVQSGETLYRIAIGYLQADLTVAQVMRSIYEANPLAFVNGDVNALEVGAMLTIPSAVSSAAVDLAIAPRAAEVYGPVQPGETLYQIAIDYQSDGLTLAQLMRLIHATNPQAFFLNDINHLKIGSILKIPSSDIVIESKSDSAGRISNIAKTNQSKLVPLDSIETGFANAERQVEPAAPPAENVVVNNKPRPKKPSSIRYSYDLSILNDDNVRLAQQDTDIRSDLIFNPSIKIKSGIKLDRSSLLLYGGRFAYSQFDTFDELNHFEVDVNLRYRFALSSDFAAPVYTLAATLGGLEFDSEMRDSTVLSVSAEVNKWITNKVNLNAGLGLKVRDSVSEVYDTSEVRIFTNFDTQLSKNDLIYTTLMLISGDVVASATPSLDIINAADAIEPDDAFGGIAGNQFAYRLDAETIVLSLGYNRILTRDMSLDVSARLVETNANEDTSIGYERAIFRLSLLGRF